MGQNLDTIKQGYQRYGEGDVDGAAEAWTDDIRWEGSNSTDLPGGGVHEGKDAVKQALQDIPNHWDEFSVQPDEWIEDGETVVVLGHNTGTPKGGGSQVKVPFVHIWRFQDGKASRVQLLTDTLEVARALGI